MSFSLLIKIDDIAPLILSLSSSLSVLCCSLSLSVLVPFLLLFSSVLLVSLWGFVGVVVVFL